MKLRALVTGCTSALGSTVVSSLLSANYEVIGTYNTNPPVNKGWPEDRFKSLKLDLSNLSNFKNLLEEKIDTFVHVASAIPSMNLTNDEMFNINVTSTNLLLRHLMENQCETFILISSMSVYGTILLPIVSEEYLPHAPDVYGRSKAEAERLFLELPIDKDVLVVRLPGIVGMNTKHNFLSKVIFNLKSSEKLVLNNPDSLFNNVAHVKDVARFLVHFLKKQKSNSNRVVNFASSSTLKLRDFVIQLKHALDSDSEISWNEGGKTPFLISIDRLLKTGFISWDLTQVIEEIRKEAFLTSVR